MGLRLFVKLGSNTGVRRYSQLCLRNGLRRVCRSVLNVNGGGAGEIMVINGKAGVRRALAIGFLFCYSFCNIGTQHLWIACCHANGQPTPQTTFFPLQYLELVFTVLPSCTLLLRRHWEVFVLQRIIEC